MLQEARAAAEHNGGRSETYLERCDRNLVELLQEVRVVQTGVQVLFAFLLTAPLAGLACVALSMVGALLLVTDLLFDWPVVVVTTAIAASACVMLWCLAPLRRRRVLSQGRVGSGRRGPAATG
jgi:membrane protein implicated in regulation of membrane protease activity